MKKEITTLETVKKALAKSNYSKQFVVTSTEKSEANSYCFINLINEDKKASSQTCFIIGFNRLNYRFSSNASFAHCDFLKDSKVNTKNRFEVTIKKDDIVKVLNSACKEYCKLHKIAVTTTATKNEKSEQQAVNK